MVQGSQPNCDEGFRSTFEIERPGFSDHASEEHCRPESSVQADDHVDLETNAADHNGGLSTLIDQSAVVIPHFLKQT